MLQHPSPYQFGYTVRAEETGDYKSHHEVSDGEAVRGVYTLGEPNGDLRVVNYTADRANGFRATVAVHPGASPAKLNRARKQHAETDDSDKRRRESSDTSLHPPRTQHDTVQPKQNTLEEKSTTYPSQNDSITLKNINTTTKSTLKIVNGSLFDVLPGLDKHVPKIEYIVEEDYGDSDGIPVYFKNIDLNSSNRPQVIPVKIQEDPYGNNLELAESGPGGANENILTKVDRENIATKQDLQHGLREAVSYPQTTASHKEITNTDTNKPEVSQNTSQLKSSTPLPLLNDQTKTKFPQIIVVNDEKQIAGTNKQNLKYTTESSVLEDSTSKLQTFVEKHTTKSKPDFVATVENQVKDGELNQTVDEFVTKIKETSSATIQTQETVLRPEDNVILAALMLQSHPIIKFTCMPDNTDQIGVKLAPIMSNVSPTSPNIPQYPVRNSPTSALHSLSVLPHSQSIMRPSTMTLTDSHPQYPVRNSPTFPLHGLSVPPHSQVTVRPSTMTSTDSHQLYQLSNHRVHPLNSVQFTSQDGQFQFKSIPEPHLYSSKSPATFIPYDATMPRSSRVDQQKPSFSDPTVEIIPPPTKIYPSLGNNGDPPHKTQNFIHNRNIPLYPIPYPWIYHPVRPSHSYHPRHLPVFVLPMSHNVNFARTFDPQFIDKHNN